MGAEFMSFIAKNGKTLAPQFTDIYYNGHLILSADALLERYELDGDGTAKNRGERTSIYAQTVIEEFFFENKKMIYAELDDESSIDEDTAKLLKKAKRDTKAAAVEMVRGATLFNPVNVYFSILAEYASENNRPELTKSADSLKMGYIEFEDALGIVFLKTVLGTAAVLSGVKHILIDEAQDFSLIQHEILKKMFPQARVTLLADTNQAIVEGINTVNQEQLAGLYGATTIKLDKSYRSTEQINEFSVSLLPENAKYEIFKRSGEPVSFVKGDASALVDLLSQEKQERTTMAVITKTAHQARALYSSIAAQVPGLRLCDNKSCEISDAPVVMPLALTKGLEFDCVVVFDDEGCFTSAGNEKYLYLASTRALHKLNIFTCEK
jgi:DNA helicase-2/ATP-dependent DNA helicase PcrA